jgi:hypothetical protein
MGPVGQDVVGCAASRLFGEHRAYRGDTSAADLACLVAEPKLRRQSVSKGKGQLLTPLRWLCRGHAITMTRGC